MEPTVIPELRFRLHPSASWVRSAWPLCKLWELWKIENDDEVSLPLEGRPSRVLVYRRGWTVTCEPLDDEAARLVEAALTGVSLSELWALSGAALDGKAVRELLESFARLVDRGVFVPAEGGSAT